MLNGVTASVRERTRMAKSLYLINPAATHHGYFGAEVFRAWGMRPAHTTADLATLTVAALAPGDWDIRICEEYVEDADFDHDCDFVGITGKVTQVARMLEIADEFRRRGKPVIIGGPHATLAPETFRDRCDILVVGELEGIAEQFFADLERGCWKKEYEGGKPDLALSPLPRWDLYPHDDILSGAVQTSRGCPFECEFCDVIQYLGRRQRHKPVDQIISELGTLYQIGFRDVFLSDDNFTVYRRRAKAALAAIRDWNIGRPDGPVTFMTQLSIDAAKDAEIMQLLSEAGVTRVFIGIETPNVESLKETRKRQNVGVDLLGLVRVFLDYGITVYGGMIVGFDNDGPDIFERQFEFAMASPIPCFSVGSLMAPVATPLYDRMLKEGRLTAGPNAAPGGIFDTNIVPKQMSSADFQTGLAWLCNRLYSPENFAKRVIRMIDCMGRQRGPLFRGKVGGLKFPTREVSLRVATLIKTFLLSGSDERAIWKDISAAVAAKPETGPAVASALFFYTQARYLFDRAGVWNPGIYGATPFGDGVAGKADERATEHAAAPERP